MVLITFKDGVSVKLYEDGTMDFLTGSDTDCDYNYHMAMAVSENFSNNEEHVDILFNKINNRLGGVLE